MSIKIANAVIQIPIENLDFLSVDQFYQTLNQCITSDSKHAASTHLSKPSVNLLLSNQQSLKEAESQLRFCCEQQ